MLVNHEGDKIKIKGTTHHTISLSLHEKCEEGRE